MDLEVSTPISAEAEIKQYTLVGDDIYVKRYTNENIPTWYRELISDIIAQDNTITDLDAAVDYLSTLPAGYNQKITELQLADTTINTSLESLVATTGSHTAAIANLDITKVDATSAAAIARDTVGAYFADGTAGAWFNNQISTYASDITANAMNISTLSTTVDNHTVSIDTVESVSLAKAQVIRSSTAPTTTTHPLLQVGDLWINTVDNITKSWNGLVWIDISNTTARTAYTWSANASKLITNPQGQITGWSFGDSSNTKSYFDIYADNFRVVNSTYNFVPFSINGSDIVFNGKVQFTNVTGTPVINQTFVQTTAPTSGMVAGDTWLDSDGGYAVYTYSGSSWVAGGSKTYSQTSAPTSGMVAGDLWVDTDDNNKLYRYNGTSWVNQTITSGGIISAINGTTNTTTIDGGKITTDSITANQIAAGAITTNELAVGAGIVNGYIQSSDYVLGGAGFRLKSNAAGTYADPTIYGAYIRGGTIDSSTMNIRQLKVINDAGYIVLPIFFAPVALSIDSSFFYLNYSIYPCDSLTGETRRLASINNNYLQFDNGKSAVFVNGNAYQVLVGCDTTISPQIYVYVGTTLIGSKISGWTSNVEYEIAGIGFVYSYSTDGVIMIRQLNPNVSIAGTGALQIRIAYNFLVKTLATASYNANCIVSNINS